MDARQSSIMGFNCRLTPLQKLILRYIGDNPGCITANIVEKFKNYDVGLVVDAVGKLKDLGLVRVSGYSTNRWGDAKESLITAGGWKKLLEDY